MNPDVNNRSVNASLVDKSYSTSRASDRRHLSELNQDKIYSSLGREKRLSSVERENKLVSPEKVLSLRRNSAGTGADAVTHTAQPLSSLLNVAADEVNGVGRSTSKTSRDFGSESRRFVSESFESRSNHLSSINKHTEYNSNELSSPLSHVLANKTERTESSKRVDNASNVKGKI